MHAKRPENTDSPSALHVSSLRLSTTSPTVPPTIEPTMSSGSWTRLTAPTWSVECVRRHACTDTATSVNWLPIIETSCPENNRRKSRECRIGARLTRNRGTQRP